MPRNPIRREVIIGDCRLILGDCLAVMPELGKVDAVVTDPPYLNLIGGASLPQGGVGKRQRHSITLGDEWQASLCWAKPAENIATRGLMVFCSHHSVVETVSAFDARPIALVTWYKRNTPAAMKNVPRHTAEFIWVMTTGGGLAWHKIKTVYDIPNLNAGCVSTGERLTNADGTVLHKAQKPLELMTELLAVEPQSVLDPFMGSGTTGVACVKLGRKFIGIEIDEGYFDIAVKRVEEAYRQPDFFVERPAPAQQLDMLEGSDAS